MRFLLAIILLTTAVLAQDKPMFKDKPLRIDSVNTKAVGIPVYTDSTRGLFVVAKIGNDGTLTTEQGFRFLRITDKELTQSQIESLYAESEALAIELIASRARAKARQEIK